MANINDLNVASHKPEVVTLHTGVETVTINGDDQTNVGNKGIRIYLDVTASSGSSPTLSVKLQIKDSLSGVYVDVPNASFAQATGTGTQTLLVYPGIAEQANVSVSSVLGNTYRVRSFIGGSNPSFTYTISGELIQ